MNPTTNRDALVSIVTDAFLAAGRAAGIPDGMEQLFEQSSASSAAQAIDALINAGVFTNDAPVSSTELAELMQSNRDRRTALITNYGFDVEARSVRVDAILEALIDQLLPAADPRRLDFELGIAQAIAAKIDVAEQGVAAAAQAELTAGAAELAASGALRE